jgi:1-acyl-sn-glycerol-3-phosphate acyltransferase
LSNAFEKTIGGNAIPRRGSWFSRNFAALILKLAGWRPQGQWPDLPKFLIVGAPHTSNWDGLLAVLYLLASGLDIHWMAKREVFDNPFRGILRWLGGIPVDRQAPQGIVEQIVERFNALEKFVVVITPEGTRKRVEKWKTGFYRIALGANVPIVLAYADYAKRVIGIGPTIIPSGDLEADLARIQSFFKTITPRHPERT